MISFFRLRPERAIKVIGACVVLHNIAVSKKLIRETIHIEEDTEIIENLNTDLPGNAYRDVFVETYFTR